MIVLLLRSIINFPLDLFIFNYNVENVIYHSFLTYYQHAYFFRNMVIWTPEQISGIWSPTVRVGDIGGQLGGSGIFNLISSNFTVNF